MVLHHPRKGAILSILLGSFANIRLNFKRMLPDQPCVLCGAASHVGAWCTACDTSLPYLISPRCPVCALPTPQGDTCGRCLHRAPLFDRTTTAFTYDFPLDKLVQAFKFGAQLALAREFARKLAPRIDTRPDCIVAMPLHPARLRERGYNQSEELARQLAHDLDITLSSYACQRVRDTPPQSALPWKERSRNMRKAFTCKGDMRGKHVAMVDDVMTSGASLNELALALRRAGASEVSAWVVARTLPNPD